MFYCKPIKTTMGERIKFPIKVKLSSHVFKLMDSSSSLLKNNNYKGIGINCFPFDLPNLRKMKIVLV
jgi:hypothetical protein